MAKVDKNYIKNSFSVLIAVYFRDNPGLFERALSSIYANSLRPDSVILVQDGPVGPELREIITFYVASYNLVHIVIAENSGLANALNEGLKVIKTEYVLRADADDFNLPNRFSTQMKLLRSGYDLVGAAVLENDIQGNLIAIRRPPSKECDIRKFIKYRNPFNHMTVAFRTEIVTNLGGYPNLFLKEDYGLWAMMISNNAKVINLDQILVHATAGFEMFKRRGGIRYISSEFLLQKNLINCGLQSLSLAFLVFLGRSFIFILPAKLRGIFYLRFLRA